MSYPRQDSVARRLHEESLRALDRLATKKRRDLQSVWMTHKRQLQASIMAAYALSSLSGKWSLSKYRSSGAEGRLRAEVTSTLEQFQAMSKETMRKSFRSIRRQSILRHAWLLDQITPDSRRVSLPHTAAREGVAFVTGGVEGARMWEERWTMWNAAYRDALMHNVALNAMNEGTIADAIQEVDATRANTPAYTLEGAMDRLYENEAVAQISEGLMDVSGLNNDLVEEEVWKTREDRLVCDDCDANEGLTADETDGDIPLHPNCHCYWLLVPESFAKLLRSGTEEDRQLASDMLARGIAPNALVIRGDDGSIAAKAIVSFGSWTNGISIGTGL